MNVPEVIAFRFFNNVSSPRLFTPRTNIRDERPPNEIWKWMYHLQDGTLRVVEGVPTFVGQIRR